MLNYAICEIHGQQFKVVPGKPFEIALQDATHNIKVPILFSSHDGKITTGKPYLKEQLILQVLGTNKKKKIRVAKYHAKANYRKVLGFRPKVTKVVLTYGT